MIGISGSLFGSKTLMELIFNPCGEFRWSPEGPVSQIHSPYFHAVASGIFSDLLSSVLMLKRECGAKSNGKPPCLFIQVVKLQPWFLSLRWKTYLRQNCNLGSWVCSGKPTFGKLQSWFLRLQWRTCPLAEHSNDDDDDDDDDDTTKTTRQSSFAKKSLIQLLTEVN